MPPSHYPIACGFISLLTTSAPKHCIATFGYPVGGIAVPVNRLGLVAPWMGLAAVVVGVVAAVLARRCRSF